MHMSFQTLLFRASIIVLLLPFRLAAQIYVPGEAVVDVDGNAYPTVVYMNGQEWMADNLRTTLCERR